eukprot:366446-Chlamydomonas_euryale.AAC.1
MSAPTTCGRCGEGMGKGVEGRHAVKGLGAGCRQLPAHEGTPHDIRSCGYESAGGVRSAWPTKKAWTLPRCPAWPSAAPAICSISIACTCGARTTTHNRCLHAHDRKS